MTLYVGSCIYYFVADVNTYRIHEFDENKLQPYKDDIWVAWQNAVFKSLINMIITCALIQVAYFPDIDFTASEVLRYPLYVLITDLYFYT